MLRKTIRRGGITLAVLCAMGIGLTGAAPAAAQGFGSGAIWERGVWSWLSSFFGIWESVGETPASGNNGGLSHATGQEGAGFDPFGHPTTMGTPTQPPAVKPDEGGGFDPFG